MSKHTTLAIIVLAVAATVATSASLTAQHENHPQAQMEPTQLRSVAPYLLDTDPVTGDRLGALESLVIVQHEGRELRFNSEESAKTFRADPTRYLANIEQALVRQQLLLYSLQTCLVSGESLEESGDEVIDYVYGNRLIRFCCKPCRPKFEENPEGYLAKLDAAVVAAQVPRYPLKTCVVSGEELGGSMGDPIDHIVGNRLVRLCCKGCKKQLAKDPLKFLRELDVAGGPRAGEFGGGHDGGKHEGGDHDHDGHDHGDHQ